MPSMRNIRVLTTLIFITTMVIPTFTQTIQSMEENNKEKTPLYAYTEKEMEKVSAYIEQQYGKSDLVGHELASPDIHCDIVIVPPTDEQPYYKLVTMGAGAYKMNVPSELKSEVCDRAEYVIFLPKDWNIQSSKEEDYWPIRMLKTIARLPLRSEDLLCYTHSVNLTDDGSPLAENTQFNSCVLLVSVGKDNQVVKPLKLSLLGKKVAFYQLYPLYQEELDYKLEHSFDELIDIIDDKDIENLVINIHRKNYGK